MRTVKKMVLFLGDSLTNHKDLWTYRPFAGSYPRGVMDRLHVKDKNILVWQLGSGGHGMARNSPRCAWSAANWLYTIALNIHRFKGFDKKFTDAYKARTGEDIKLAPDAKIHTVMLYGTIDVGRWDDTKLYFKQDYIAQIPRFDEGQVFVGLIPPQLYDSRANGLINTEVNPIIEEVAKATGARVIDYNSATQNKVYFHDSDIHWNEAGNKVAGDICFAGIKNTVFGSAPPPTPPAPPPEPGPAPIENKA